MNRIYKSVVSVLLSASVILMVGAVPNYAETTEQDVRIGLFYSDAANGIKNELPSFTISADKGVQLGTAPNGVFSSLIELSDNNILVRKDAFYIINGTTATEYGVQGTPISAGVNVGPYHVQIGGNFNSLYLANQQIDSLKTSGIIAYPVFMDTWQVWTGFYLDKNVAQKELDNMKNMLGFGLYNVIEPSQKRIVVSSSMGETLFVFACDTQYLQIYPKAENNPYILKINNKKYRGGIEVRRLSSSDMTVINLLTMEQYLYGVVPSEIESYSNPEALKAQAVAARTYTLNSLDKHENQGFDLCTTTSCQVYKGYEGEAASTNKAVDDTKGEKLKYNGKLAQVFYFSSSGGRTEDSKNVWTSDIPYLRSVEDKYESGKSYHYNWDKTVKASEIKNMMISKGKDIGDILSVTVTKRSDAGRAIELIIKGTNGEQLYSKGACRSVFTLDSQWYEINTDTEVLIKINDTDTVKSQLANKKLMTANGLIDMPIINNQIKMIGNNNQIKTINVVPTEYKIIGKGWGHAIGMSQEGAKGMAAAGFTYEQILTHYFQGTNLE